MPAAFIVVTIGRKPPLASANPVTTPVPSATGVLLMADATPDVPIETRTSPGSRAMPSAAPMLSPVPPAIVAPVLVVPARPAGCDEAGEVGAVPERLLEQVGSPLACGSGEVAGARGVAAVGERLGVVGAQVERDVVVGEQDARHPCGVLRLVVAQPAQLGGGERGDEDAADRVGAGLRSAHLLDEVERRTCRAGVVPEEGVAHRCAGRVQRHHAVLLAGDRDRVGAVEQAVGRLVDGTQPGPRVDLGARRVRRRTRLDDLAAVGVHQEGLGRLGGGVDAQNESHVTIKYESRTNVKVVWIGRLNL